MRKEPKTNPGMKTRIGTRPYRASTVLTKQSKTPSEAFPMGQMPEASSIDSPATSEFESSLASEATPELERDSQVKGHIYVTGVPAVGKTTEGERLSKERGLPLISLDGTKVKSTDDARRFVKENLDSPHVVEGSQILGFGPEDIGGHELVHLKQPADVIIDRLASRGWTDSSGNLVRGKEHEKKTTDFYNEMRGHEQEFENRMKKVGAAVKAGPGEFAPGIPGDRGIYGIQKTSPRGPNREWTASLSMHPAARRGDHHDLRLIDQKGRAHSWAFQDMPTPGKSTYAVQQPTHKKEYALRTKPFTIPEGYGMTRPGAQVEPKFVSQVEVVESDNDKVRFLKHEGQNTQEFVVRKLVPSMGDIRPLWALNNATKNRGTGEGKKIPAYKPKYKEVAPEGINLDDSEQVMTPKLDGAHVLVDLPGEGDKFARVYSYRPTARETGLIEHTFKFNDFQKRRGSPEIKNTMVRAELWASDKDGKAIPAEQVGGLLNAGVLKSRKKQKEMGVKLRLTGFDVVRHNGRNMEKKPFAEKLEVLNKVKKVTRGFVEVPEVAATPEQKKKMLEQIKGRQRSDTDEGVVLHSINKAEAPIKAKFKPDVDVFVRKVFDKPKGKERGHAGGFEYSYTPDGPIVGRVGTGFDHNTRSNMLESPERYVGRVAKVQSVRRAENITDTSQLNKALRAPSFQGWHLDKTDPQLMENDIEKKAEDDVNPVAAGATALGGAAILANPATRGRLLGYQRVYHGTAPDNVASLKEHGILRNMPVASDSGPEVLAQQTRDRVKGKVFVSRAKPFVSIYGSPITADLPMEEWAKFEADRPGVIPSYLASKAETDIDPKFIHGGKGFDKASLIKERLKGLPQYIRKHPGRFASGVGLGALGTGLALKGISGLREHYSDDDASVEKSAEDVTETLKKTWLNIQNRAQPENIIDEATARSRQLQKLKPVIGGVAKAAPVQNSEIHKWIQERVK